MELASTVILNFVLVSLIIDIGFELDITHFFL